ncbi:2,4-dichlorophenol 6-monooxygenase [Cadophora sp. MPI-SDFR-AT-0126]|nr:2,4-dichlorophenol 6-monooxygenase [Leotiomycetes sp. MPI-SDFR-AT-0126]
MASQRLPVAIVGGGPVGLVSSILLSLLKIPHRVFEQFPGTSIHPKACGLNQRTVELFRHIGIEDEFKQHRAPKEIIGKTGWFTGIGRQDREILVRDAWGAGKYAGAYKKFSPCEYSVLPQIRLEPLLQKRALELSTDAVQYSSKVTEVTETAEHVALKVQGRDGTSQEIHADYVLAADGGRGMAEQLGIGWIGERDILDMITVHFKADLSKSARRKDVFISWLINPTMKGSLGTGYLYHLGPYNRPNRIGDEYVLATPKLSDDPTQFDTDATIARVRRSLGIPELDVDILSLSHWLVNARVTDRYRSKGGRVFLVGDACHRVPPWGALGLNTGFGDAQNIVWKLAMAIKSGNPTEFDKLLDTYEEERQPIATIVAKNSLKNMRNHAGAMDTALGITPEASAEENTISLNAYYDASHPEYKAKRKAVEKASEQLDHEFNAPGIEIGWFYPSLDIEEEGKASRHGGQVRENGDFDFTTYHPSTLPGHNLPHAWLEKDGRTISTKDLTRRDKFVLLTHGDQRWHRYQSSLIDIEVINPRNGWKDIDGAWAEVCDIDASGAILVRPDGVVALRSKCWERETPGKLKAVFEHIFGGPIPKDFPQE